MQWLVAPTGVSQLLTQLSAMSYAGAAHQGACAISACYYWGQEMEAALQETCDAFGLQYLGNVDPIEFHAASLKASSLTDRLRWRLSPSAFHKRWLSRRGWCPPPDIDGLVVCVRPWVVDELFFYSAIDPKEVICTIDGINPRSPDRVLQGRTWKGLDAPFRDIPTKCPIYCPEYLTADARLLGAATPIPREIERRVLARYAETPLAQQLHQLLLEQVERSRAVAVIFSQQLAQSGYLSTTQEAQYYLQAVDTLRRRGFESIILKPHPRDPKDKLAELAAATSKMKGVCIVPNELSCVPIEPFLSDFSDCEILAASTNSTVLLSFRALTNADAVSVDSPHFTPEFRHDRDRFCRTHGVDVIVP